MLSFLGFATVAVMLYLLLTNRVHAVVALIAAPLVTALVAGVGPAELGAMMTAGVKDVAGVAAMFVFGILYFGIMRDAGLFDPLVRGALRFGGSNPITVAIATAVVAMLTHLDGAGATTFLITIPAMLPIFDALGMSRLVLTTIVGLGAGIMNMVPWGGPGARAATVVGVDPNSLWVPLLPAQAAGIVAVLAVAGFLGLREKRRLARDLPGDEAWPGSSGGTARRGSRITTADRAGGGRTPPHAAPGAVTTTVEERTAVDTTGQLRRPRLWWANLVLTLLTVAVLISGIAPSEAVFMVAFAAAITLNYPGYKAQGERIDAHAQGAILMGSTLLASGAFLGIMGETGMIEAMASTIAELVPAGAMPLLPLIVGVLAVPLSFLFGPDPYYYGVLPILTQVGEQFGIDPIVVAQASLTGEETLGFPVTPMTGSFFLLVGLAGVGIGDHIKKIFPWAWGVNLLVLAVAVLTGVIPVWA